MIARARRMLEAQLDEDAGRAAYLAAFHAAQAFVFEGTGRVPKTHNGVQARFWSLTQDDPAFPAELRKFLARAYELKTIADYETDSAVLLSPQAAKDAVERANEFLTCVTGRLARPDRPDRR